MTAHRIDLNADLGEGFGPWEMGDDASMLGLVTSANIACGGHASDPETMFKTVRLAAERGVVIGAHPGYNDPIGFGRRIIPMPPAEIGRMIAAQVGALQGIAALAGTSVRYVKPHGALGNLAARDAEVAKAIADAVGQLDGSLAVLAISGTALEVEAQAKGLATYSEIFADRGYQPNGQLVPRGEPGAMIHDPSEAADRLIGFLQTGLMPVVGGDPIPLKAASICVHGDGPKAVQMAQGIRTKIAAQGIDIESFIGDA